jgi:hypothetical protein
MDKTQSDCPRNGNPDSSSPVAPVPAANPDNQIPKRDFSAMGKKAAGSKSESGLARSARNSTKHGLTGNAFYVLHNEDTDVFAAHKKQYYEALRPTDVIECSYVDRMVEQSWRLHRVNAMEAEALSLEIEEQRKQTNLNTLNACIEDDDATQPKQTGPDEIELARTELAETEPGNPHPLPALYSETYLAWLAGGHLAKHNAAFANLHRYRNSIERTYERAHKSLLSLRAGKQPNLAAPYMLPAPEGSSIFKPSPTQQRMLQQIKAKRAISTPSPVASTLEQA